MSAPPLRVLFIAPQPFFKWRGSPIRVAFDAQALAELGYEVDLLTLPIGEEKAIPGVQVIRVGNPFRVQDLPIGPSFWKAFFDVLLLLRAFKLARRQAYDIVHAVEDAGIIGVLLQRFTGARLIFEKHSDPASYRRGPLRNLVMFMYTKFEAFTMRHADALIGTGPGLIAQAKDVAPDTVAHHIFDIPSSLAEADPESVAKAREELVQGPDEVLVTYVGSFAVYQGIELLFDIIPTVARRHPTVHFVIIGGTTDEIRDRKERLATQGVAEQVTFLGKIPPDELPNYLAASDILLSPRIAGRNTPLKLLDYLKANRAIMATDTEANRLILDASNAVVAEPQTAEFAAALGALIEDPARRAELGRKGHNLIEKLYNFDEFKRRMSICYNYVLEGTGRGGVDG